MREQPRTDAASGGPSAQDRMMVQRAAALRRPLARAARVAHANGSGYVVFGGLSLLLAAPGLDAIGLVLGGALVAAGVNARRQADLLRQADPQAPRRLARGELALLGALVLYGVLGLTVLPDGSADLQKAVGDTRGLGIDVRKLAASIHTAWYATVIGLSILYQGGLARYFQRRAADVASYRDEVPQWARDLAADAADS